MTLYGQDEKVVDEVKRRVLEQRAANANEERARKLNEMAERVRNAGDDTVHRQPDVFDRIETDVIGSPEPIDNQRSVEWAIAPLQSVGWKGPNIQTFELVNRMTGRAHKLEFLGIGLDRDLFPIDVPTGETDEVSYTMFSTDRPVNFSDFEGMGARLTSARALAASVTYLTLWDGPWYVTDRIAYVRMAGWGLNTLGAGFSHSIATVTYGDGSQTTPFILQTQPEFSRPPRDLDISAPAMEDERIDVPNEVLFEFDSAELKPVAEQVLYFLADHLNNRLKLPVEIEGHTDNKGSADYNMKLSRRRAETVKQWFVDHQVLGVEWFDVTPYGETQPVAPNENPDGSDNPEGRRQNRRVTIRAVWNVPLDEE